MTATSLDSPGALFVALGRALLDHGRPDDAFDAFKKGLEESDACAQAAAGLVTTATAKPALRPQALQLCLRQVHQARGGAALVTATHALLTRSSVRATAAWLERWLEQLAGRYDDVPGEPAFLAGRLQLYLGRPQEALELLERADGERAGDARVLEGLGEAQRLAGRLDESILTLERALAAAHEGDHARRAPTIATKLGQALVAAGRYADALTQLQGEVETAGHYAYERSLARSQCELGLGLHDAAHASASDAARRRPSAVHPQLVLAQVLLARHDDGAALEACERGLAGDPSSEESLLCKAQALLEGGVAIGRARRLLKRGLGARTLPTVVAAGLAGRAGDASALYARAELAFARGDLDAAAADVERARERLDGDVPAVSAALEALGAEIRCAREPGADAAAALSRAGDGYLDLGHYERAIELLRPALERIPDDQPTLWRLGHAYAGLGSEAATAARRRELLERALDVWGEGLAAGPPGGDFAWVLASRASVRITLASQELDRADELYWDAIVDLERSLVTRSWLGVDWTLLGRAHTAVDNPATALLALEQATEIGDEPDAWGELAALLREIGDPRALDAVRDARARLGDAGSWLIDAEAALLAELGRFEEAIQIAAAPLRDDPDRVDCRVALARLQRLTGDPDAARENYELARRSLRADKQLGSALRAQSLGWIDYQLGDLEPAGAAFRRVLEERSLKPFDAHVNLGYVALLEGRCGELHERFELAFESPTMRSRIVEARLDLTELRTRVESAEQLAAIDRELDRVARELADWGAQPLGADAMCAELERGLDAPGAARTPRGLAALAGLARQCFADERMDEAAERYEALLEHDAQAFPEARDRLIETLRAGSTQQRQQGDPDAVARIQERLLALGATQRLTARVEIAHARRAAGDREGAIAELTGLGGLAGDPDAAALVQRTLVELQLESGRIAEARAAAEAGRAAVAGDPAGEAVFEALLGLCVPDALDLRATVAHFRRSLALAAGTGDATAGVAAAIDVDPPLIGSPDRFNTVAEALAVVSAAASEDGVRHALKALRLSLSRVTYRSLRHRASAEPDGETLLPAPLPIVFEGDPSLFPQLEHTPEVGRLLEEDIPRMRDAIFDDTGVMVPGVRMRPGYGLGHGRYRLLLHDVEVERGSTRIGLVYEPRTGSWRPAAGAAGDALDPHGFVMWRLERAVRRRLSTFFGLPELRYLVERRCERGADPEVERVLGDGAARPRLVEATTALLREDVALLDVATLLRAFARAPEGETAERLAARLRRALVHALPGVRDRRELLAAGDELERGLLACAVDVDGQRIFAPSCAAAADLRRAVLERGAGDGVALVVQDADVRAPLARLVAGTGTVVVSAAELELATEVAA